MSQIRGMGYLLAGLLAAALLSAFVWKPPPPPKFMGISTAWVPLQLAGFTGQDIPVNAVTRAALSSAQIVSRSYRAPDGMLLDMTLIGGTDRTALHDPRSCLVGAGFRLGDDHLESLPGVSPDAQVRVCNATKGSDQANSGYDIIYLYVTHKHVVASASEIRLALLESALLEQNDAPVYYLRILAPAASGSAGAARHARLMEFTAKLWNQLSPHILGEKSA